MLKSDQNDQKCLVFFIGALGYIYIFSILTVLGWLGIQMLHVIATKHGHAGLFKIVFVDAVLIFLILKSLWVTVPRPIGYKVTATDCPELFQLIHQIQVKLKTPKIHEVLITEDVNASVVQYAQWGILGGYKNYLMLGFPLMRSLSVEQFTGILTHELGHISSAHGKSGIWVYRIRTTWFQLAEHLSGQGWLAEVLFRKFFEWYVPYFAEISLKLSRLHEFEADRAAVDFVGVRPYAQGFMRMSLNDRLVFDQFWTDLSRRVKDLASPPKDVYTQLFHKMQQPIMIPCQNDWLQEDLRLRTNKYDTHPSLKERLEYIGCKIEPERILDDQGSPLDINEISGQSFAEKYLEKSLFEKIIAEFNCRWQENIKDTWQNKHAEIVKLQEQIKQYEADPQQAQSADALMGYVKALGTYGTDEEYTQALQKLIHVNPSHAGALYEFGLMRLKAKDESGVSYLKKAAELDPMLAVQGYGVIQNFYERQGNYQKSDYFRQLMLSEENKSQEIYEEQNTVTPKDEFIVPQDPELAMIKDQLEHFRKDLKAVYLVQKQTKMSGLTKVIVVFIQFHLPWYRYVRSGYEQELLDKISKQIKTPQTGPFYFLFFGSMKPAMRKVRKLKGALILNARSGFLKDLRWPALK